LTTVADPQPVADPYVRAKAIAMALLDCAPQLRGDALAQACRDDVELTREVQWLLDAAEDAAHDAGASLTLADPLAGGDIHLEAPVPRDYRVLRRIGEGGMGVVYLAERIDGQLHQRVALKLLHPLPDADDQTQRRFATERRILSTLNHPNIAHLIDGGVTAAGRPFLAMEYVDGERIDAFCDTHALTQRQRIALFLKVCAAVEHAHRRLVIHRDIKPSNILVGSDGEPKLLDFGIARLLDDVQAEHTRTDRRALTLAYASPEQIEGGPLVTASDVYSLGVLLYQLVAGLRPFDHLGTAHLQLQAIVSGDVVPPSRRARDAARADAASNALRRGVPLQRVPADLDAIVLKAMRREPEQRYATASALAADLRRFLAEHPVRAQRGHWGYRMRRFAWRRRWVLAAAGMVVAAVSVFTVDRLRQHERIAIERDRASAVVQYMDALYQNTDALHVRGKDVTVRQMLDLGAASLRTRADLSPGHQAALLIATGRAYNALGLSQDAVPLLEQARDILIHSDAGAEQRAALALAMAAAYSGSRRLAEAMAADEDALQFLHEDPERHANEIAQATIRLLHNHAVTLDLPLTQIRARLDAVLVGLDARPNAPQSLKLAAYRALAMAYGGDGEGARAAAEHAVLIATRLYPANDPRLLPVRYVYVTTVQEHDPARAADLLPELIADHERRMGASVRVASLLGNLGSTLTRIGKPRESLPVFERALAMAGAVSGEDSQLYRLIVGNFAAAQLALGHGERAAELVGGVLPGLAAAAQAEGDTEAQVFLAAARETLAEAALLRGDAETAESELTLAADGLMRIEREAYPEMYARVLLRLAEVQHERGRDDAATRTLGTLDAAIEGRSDAASARFRDSSKALRAAMALPPM
jgi:tRNA A-37 threonylcarbamoyl transferase component Bud32/tetratricopeptide (TPR) repeat protein